MSGEDGFKWQLDKGGYCSEADVICISAAPDDQVACTLEAMNRPNFAVGAFAASVLVACDVHENQYKCNRREVLGIVKNVCSDFRFRQSVQLFSSQAFDLTRQFDVHDNIPNTNTRKRAVKKAVEGAVEGVVCGAQSSIFAAPTMEEKSIKTVAEIKKQLQEPRLQAQEE